MTWVLLVAAIVAILQGAAWLGPREGAPRAVRGAALASAGVIAFGFALLHLCVPDFFAR